MGRGLRRGSALVPAWAADERHRVARGRAGLLRRVPHAAGPDDRRPVGLRARRRAAVVDGSRRQARRCWPSSISSSSPRTCSWATSARRSPRPRSSDRVRPQAIAAASIVPRRELVAALAEHGNVRDRVRAGSLRSCSATTDTGERGFDVLVESTRPRGSARAARAPRARRRSTPPLPKRCASRRACRGFTATWTRRRFRSKPASKSRAISLTKGCYVGQEVIIRVLHRGHGRVARKLVGLTVRRDRSCRRRGRRCRPRAAMSDHVTSSAWSPALERPIALAYVHRDFVAGGDGGSPSTAARPS